MKKLMYIAAALLVLVGCNKKDNALNNTPEGTPFKKGQQVTLTVGTGAQQGPNKVAGIDAGTQIDFTWEEGDQILVKVGENTATFTLSSGAGLNEGVFAGEMPAAGSTFDIQYPIEEPDLSAQEYTTDKTIPADKMLFTATGCVLGESASLAAQNAMVQLNLYGTDKTVGKIVFTDKTADPAVSYTLTCTDGKTIGATSAEATPFYMVVLAGEYQFEVEVYDAAATPAMICSFATSAAQTFVADKCLNMPAKEVVPMYNGHAYVDLGLPSGLKWATMNVGATKEEDYGDYFAWGETAPYYNTPITDPISWKTGKETGYNWASYFDTKDGGSTFQKYNLTGGKTTLEPEDDAANVNWGGNWRMPTKDELDELKTSCTWTWTQKNGINGYEVEGPNKNKIFLPAAGCRNGSSLDTDGSYGLYWSSLLLEDNSDNAHYLDLGSKEVFWYYSSRRIGQSVRPVYNIVYK